MTLDASGRLGIGTTSPSARLQANTTINTVYSSSNTLTSGVIAYIRNDSSTNATAATLRLDALGSANVAAASISAVHTGDAASALTFGTRTNASSDVTERARIDSSGNLLVGTTSSGASGVTIGGSSTAISYSGTGAAQINNYRSSNIELVQRVAGYGIEFYYGAGSYAGKFDSSGNLLVGKTSTAFETTGGRLAPSGEIIGTVNGGTILYVNRLTSDGNLVEFSQATILEGTISVSGTTVSYNGGHLSRWAQFPDNSRPELLKGTVMSNLDQMSNWDQEDNEQLNCVQVSAVEGDANVAGVFVAWDTTDDDYNDILLAMTGDMVIRIAGGTTVQRGDLLMSAGDGTAKPQGDDIVRSKTIAKVTSTHVSHTYADGSYAVPCVLMAC
jgi:hypothetical protein